MTSTKDTEYTCTLDAASLEKARKELNEDEKNRQGAVQTLREWVQIQPWLKSPIDTPFLLRFLRTQKFSQLKAREILEKYWKFRTEYAEISSDKDTSDPKIQEVIRSGLILRLPRVDRDGRIYMMFRYGALEAGYIKETIGVVNVYRTMTCILDWINMDERAQVNGLVVVVDMTGYTAAHRAIMNTPGNLKRSVGAIQGYPMRVKKMHFYNSTPIFEAVMAIVKTLMSPKMRDRMSTVYRMKSHGRSLVTLYEDIDKDVLPKEYLDDDFTGPNSGSVKSISDWMISELTKPEVADYIKSLSDCRYGVNLKLKPIDDECASFRKLHID